VDSSSSENSSSTVLPQIGGDAPPGGAVRAELERVLSSTLFRDAEGLKRFLRYTVENTLQGEGDQLKEYRLGVDVFDRDSSFDPRLDPVVRMAARRLRSKLREYYETEGCQDAVWIDVPKGGYAATFGGKPTPDPLIPPTVSATAADKFSRRAFTLSGSAVLVVCIALVVAYRLRPKPVVSQADVATHVRRSVAVLGFANVSGRSDKAWLSTAFSEMLTTELAAGEQLRTVPGENVARMKISLSLPEADSYGRETLARIRQNLDAEDVVVGSYILLGKDQVRLDLRLQDTANGETLAAISAKGSEAEIDDLVSRSGSALREKLGVGAVSAAQAAAVKATLPSNSESARLYAEGLVKLRRYDNLGARDVLTRALAIEPSFALGHAALATAWSSLGYDGRAREESRKAVDLSANLSSEERLWIEAHYRELAEGPDKAVDTYRILFQSFPDNLEYGLRLAYVQYHASKGQDALATIAHLRKLAPPIGDDPRFDVAEADAAFSLGDYKRYHLAAARGAEKALARGATLLAAEALADDC
jgi:TolB-like protein